MRMRMRMMRMLMLMMLMLMIIMMMMFDCYGDRDDDCDGMREFGVLALRSKMSNFFPWSYALNVLILMFGF